MSGCGILGAALVEGQHIPRDLERGRELLEQACYEGFAPGCSVLGEVYMNGVGVPAAPFQAVELFARGCQNGDPDGCRQLESASDGALLATASVVMSVLEMRAERA